MAVAEPFRMDRSAYAAEIQGGAYLAGVAHGRWRIIAEAWPVVFVVLSASPRPGAPPEFAFKIDLTNFPADAPTATPWDVDTDSPLPLDRRPRGGRADTVFRRDQWENGTALYAAWDRVALAGHPNWIHQHPHLAWHPQRTFVFFLERTMELFNCDAYLGT